MHPHTVLRTVDDHIGVGVFANRPIPRGTITWARDPLDLALPKTTVQGLDALSRAIVERYAWEEAGSLVLCWDHARYVNHSCDANCLGLAGDYEIALRDIAAGEELTDDYRSLGPFDEPWRCLCGAATCTGWVRAEPGLEVRRRWREAFDAALPDMPRVPQPLGAYVSAPSRVAL